MAEALMRGEEMERLLPQRAPIRMVDALYSVSDLEAETGLTLAADNMFVAGGRFREPGLVEHIAQSASAMAGYKAFKLGQPAPVGFIGEVKKCQILHLPVPGQELRTHLEIISELGGISLLRAETCVDGQPVATTQMKIFIDS